MFVNDCLVMLQPIYFDSYIFGEEDKKLTVGYRSTLSMANIDRFRFVQYQFIEVIVQIWPAIIEHARVALLNYVNFLANFDSLDDNF